MNLTYTARSEKAGFDRAVLGFSMTKNTKLRKAIRTRMARTGESYTTARMHIRAKQPPTGLMSEAEHVERVSALGERVRERLGRNAWDRLLLDQSGFPEVDWDGLDLSSRVIEFSPYVAAESYHHRLALLDRAADLMRVQVDSELMNGLLASLTERSSDLTGTVPEHTYPNRFNTELDEALDRHESRHGADTGSGHILMHVKEYAHHMGFYRDRHGKPVDWVCACGLTHTSNEVGAGFPWEEVEDRALARVGVFAHYRGYEVVVSKVCVPGEVLVLPDPSHLGRIRVEVVVTPGKRDANIVFKADGVATVETALDPGAAIYRYSCSDLP